jgi:sodium transport system permease protein
MLAEAGCVLVPALAYVAARRLPASALGLGRARPLAIAGGVLVGVAAFYVSAAVLQAWVERLWPTPPEVRRALERMVVPASGPRPLALDLFAFALVPAVAEELLFRGLVYGALKPRTGAAGAVVISAALFGAYHGSVHRLVPAMFGGLMLGSVRAASGSLWPALAYHIVNNAIVVVAMHCGLQPPPTLLFGAGALVVAVAGFALVVRSRA